MINEPITGSNVSSETSPVESMSDVVIAGEAAGLVFLQVKSPNTTEWVNITNQSGAYVVMTPDPTLLYRFRASKLLLPVQVHFGP